eukprot:8735195-Heterocapsa_arctica.AAC.1
MSPKALAWVTGSGPLRMLLAGTSPLSQKQGSPGPSSRACRHRCWVLTMSGWALSLLQGQA